MFDRSVISHSTCTRTIYGLCEHSMLWSGLDIVCLVILAPVHFALYPLGFLSSTVESLLRVKQSPSSPNLLASRASHYQ